jgi:GNAT superfamily N-acetyltransferase
LPPRGCRQERLGPNHSLTAFNCGHQVLDDWLKSAALNAERMGTARTRVWVDSQDVVIAYFSLAPHVVMRDDVEKKVGRGSPHAIPSVLLARLALDRTRQGRGEGSLLLVDSLTLAIEGMRDLGGRLIVVDAIDENAAAFYHKHGFIPCPGRTDRLVIKASDVAVSLGLPWP